MITDAEKALLEPAYQSYKKSGSGRATVAVDGDTATAYIDALEYLSDERYIVILKGDPSKGVFHLSPVYEAIFEYEITARGVSYFESVE